MSKDVSIKSKNKFLTFKCLCAFISNYCQHFHKLFIINISIIINISHCNDIVHFFLTQYPLPWKYVPRV